MRETNTKIRPDKLCGRSDVRRAANELHKSFKPCGLLCHGTVQLLGRLSPCTTSAPLQFTPRNAE